MKTHKKREISHITNKKRISKSPLFNCYSGEEVVNGGKFDILCLVEGYYVQGLRQGLWINYADMFKVLGSNGIRYHYVSYMNFRNGRYFYIPNQVISALAFLVGCASWVVSPLGLAEALRLAAKYPERWVVPPYALAV